MLRVPYSFHRIIVSFQYNPPNTKCICPISGTSFHFLIITEQETFHRVSVFQKHLIYLPCVQIRDCCAWPNGPIIITDVGSTTFRNPCITFCHATLSLRHCHTPLQTRYKFRRFKWTKSLHAILPRSKFQMSLKLFGNSSHEEHLTDKKCGENRLKMRRSVVVWSEVEVKWSGRKFKRG